jgi:hypothetical protein
MDLFGANAAWGDTASRVGVFKIYPQWAGHASDSDLRKQFNDLRKRGISLALEYGPLSYSHDCAKGLPGEGAGGDNLANVAKRIRQDGGELKYIAMDEPLFFAGMAPGNNTCTWSVDKVAEDAATHLDTVKAVFPDVQFGDTEPLGFSKQPVAQELARYLAGIRAFEKALGRPIAFFHLDLNWNSPELGSDLQQAKQMLASENVPMGIIYDGSALATSDSQWLRLAEKHIHQVESAIGSPSMVIFQSWHAYPKKLLPETDSDSFTYLLREYHPR